MNTPDFGQRRPSEFSNNNTDLNSIFAALTSPNADPEIVTSTTRSSESGDGRRAFIPMAAPSSNLSPEGKKNFIASQLGLNVEELQGLMAEVNKLRKTLNITQSVGEVFASNGLAIGKCTQTDSQDKYFIVFADYSEGKSERMPSSKQLFVNKAYVAESIANLSQSKPFEIGKKDQTRILSGATFDLSQDGKVVYELKIAYPYAPNNDLTQSVLTHKADNSLAGTVDDLFGDETPDLSQIPDRNFLKMTSIEIALFFLHYINEFGLIGKNSEVTREITGIFLNLSSQKNSSQFLVSYDLYVSINSNNTLPAAQVLIKAWGIFKQRFDTQIKEILESQADNLPKLQLLNPRAIAQYLLGVNNVFDHEISDKVYSTLGLKCTVPIIKQINVIYQEMNKVNDQDFYTYLDDMFDKAFNQNLENSVQNVALVVSAYHLLENENIRAEFGLKYNKNDLIERAKVLESFKA